MYSVLRSVCNKTAKFVTASVFQTFNCFLVERGGWRFFHTSQERYILNVVLGFPQLIYSCSNTHWELHEQLHYHRSLTTTTALSETRALFLPVWLITLHQDAVSDAWDNYKWLCRRFHNACLYGPTAFPFAINYFHLKL